MSGMMLRSNGKPPLAARSPIQLRSRIGTLGHPAGTAARSFLPGSLMKPPLPRDVDKPELHPDYHMSCELRALTKMVNEQLGNMNDSISDGGHLGSERNPLFVRGRFYDEYSVRRNERLWRKKGEMQGYEKKHVYDLGVRVESAMKREAAATKYAAAAATPETKVVQIPRYSLRSSSRKENKKPPLPVMNLADKLVGVTQRKASVRKARKV